MSLLYLSKSVSASIEVRKSKFESYLYRCGNIDELKIIRDNLRDKNKGARHIVYAAIFGESGSMFAMSDDGEPKGTGGRPCLEVLKGSGASEVAVLVVRYFGGILLGPGGLARAYSDSVREVLSKAEFEKKVEKVLWNLDLSYAELARIQSFLSTNDIKIKSELMDERVRLSVVLEKNGSEIKLKNLSDMLGRTLYV